MEYQFIIDAATAKLSELQANMAKLDFNEHHRAAPIFDADLDDDGMSFSFDVNEDWSVSGLVEFHQHSDEDYASVTLVEMEVDSVSDGAFDVDLNGTDDDAFNAKMQYILNEAYYYRLKQEDGETGEQAYHGLTKSDFIDPKLIG